MGKIIFEDYPSTKTPIDASTLNAMQDELINLIYPIGSIFMSSNNTNPSNYLGGKWEQIKDKFLLSAGDTYEAGSVGGEATHTLTVDEMPSHKHDTITFDNGGNTFESQPMLNYGWQTKGWVDQTIIKESGGNKSHNNMPPYLTVYMWQRVE